MSVRTQPLAVPLASFGGLLDTAYKHRVRWFDSILPHYSGQVAQQVEHCVEGAGVAGSIPALSTISNRRRALGRSQDSKSRTAGFDTLGACHS